jgi:hypothetical protein
VALGGRGRVEWRSNQRIAVAVLLASSLGVVFFAFAPDLARAAHLDPDDAWRVSTGSFAAYRLVAIVAAFRAGRRAIAGDEPGFGPWRISLLSLVGGISIVVGQLLTAAGLLSSWLFFFYLLGLLWELAIATFVFALLLMNTMSSRPAV